MVLLLSLSRVIVSQGSVLLIDFILIFIHALAETCSVIPVPTV